MIYYKKWSNFPRTSQISRRFCWNFPRRPVFWCARGQISFVCKFPVRPVSWMCSIMHLRGYCLLSFTDVCVQICCGQSDFIDLAVSLQWVHIASFDSVYISIYLFFLVCYLKSIVVDWRMTQHAISHSGQNMTETHSLFFEHMHREFCLIYMTFCCHYLIHEQIFGVFFYDRKNGDVGDWCREFLVILYCQNAYNQCSSYSWYKLWKMVNVIDASVGSACYGLVHT